MPARLLIPDVFSILLRRFNRVIWPLPFSSLLDVL